jgi:hypothetical protein
LSSFQLVYLLPLALDLCLILLYLLLLLGLGSFLSLKLITDPPVWRELLGRIGSLSTLQGNAANLN